MNKVVIGTGILGVLVMGGMFYAGSKETSVETLSTNSTAYVGVVGIKNTSGLAAIFNANGQVISWITDGLASSKTVDINLIRKVSDSPATYVLVRKIADDIKNTGSFVWKPGTDELGTDLFIEVTCSGVSDTAGCEVVASPVATQ